MINLLDFSEAGGCGCKIPSDKLDKILFDLNIQDFRNGFEGNFNSREDCSIFDLNTKEFMLSSVDFFSPIVNDAYTFGVISAANALSDIYAKGGTPIFALSVLGWPIDKLSLVEAREVVRGAKDKCNEAKIPIVGGHTINNSQPFFGLAVNGIVDKVHLKRNNLSKSGALIFLTKPIGVGILSTALKMKILDTAGYEEMIRITSSLNNFGVELGKLNYVQAMTDLTGFGLIGHLLEMLPNENVGIKLYYNKIKFVDSAIKLAKNIETKGGKLNSVNSIEHISTELNINMNLLNDPQTNGGLIISIDPSFKNQFLNFLKENSMHETHLIGKFVCKDSISKKIEVV